MATEIRQPPVALPFYAWIRTERALGCQHHDVRDLCSSDGTRRWVVIVIFFSFWSAAYGRKHLGKIQGAAQALTVIASALGPLILAETVSRTGSYATIFYLLTVVVTVLALLAWIVRLPGEKNESHN